MSNRELIAELQYLASTFPENSTRRCISRAAAALEAQEWQPIETAPTTPFTLIEVGWWEDGWHGIELVQLLLSRIEWTPGDERKVWLHLNSNNYTTIQQAHQWPTHWRPLPDPPQD